MNRHVVLRSLGAKRAFEPRWLSTTTTVSPSRQEIIQKLRGQQVRIPDLRKVMVNWPYDTNPQAYVVDDKINQLITTHTYSDKVRERLQKARLSELLAGWYPYASQRALEGLTSFLAWMFIVDDVIDTYAEQGQFAKLENLTAECSDYISRSLGILPKDFDHTGTGVSPSSPSLAPSADVSSITKHDNNNNNNNDDGGDDYYTEPSVRAFAEVGRALVSAASTETLRQRVAREIAFTLASYRQEQTNRFRGHIPTVPEYLAYRVGSSCTLQMTAMIEFANDLRLPEEVMEGAELRDVYEAEARVQWLTNDIISAGKEVQQGFVENLVVLLSEGGRDAQRGMDGTVQMLEEAKARLDETSAALLDRHGSGPYAEQVQLVVRNCKAMCTGNLVWSLSSPRYALGDKQDKDGSVLFKFE